MIARMSQAPPAIAANSETDRKVIDWLEANLGAVTRFAPHARWRAGWDAEVVQDGKPLELYIRGPRGANHTSPISMTQEAAIHRAYLANGIPVPRAIGLIDDPEALVLERISGMIDAGTIPDPATRQKVREEFIEIIAPLHRARQPSPPKPPTSIRISGTVAWPRAKSSSVAR